MRIKIIADNPEDGQESIKELIGKEFEVKEILGHGRVSVILSLDEIPSILNQDEYQIVEDTPVKEKSIWQKIGEFVNL